MKECEKKSPLRCLNCKRENCDMKKITMILAKLNLLKEVILKTFSIRNGEKSYEL